MNREEAVKELFKEGCVMGMYDFLGIDDLPSVTPTQKWIPVSERLPEPRRLVVCYITTGATETYFIAFWNDVQKAWEEGIGGCRLLERDLGYEVVAWMPLPEPYKAGMEFEETKRRCDHD